MNVKWDILILTQPSRRSYLDRLTRVLHASKVASDSKEIVQIAVGMYDASITFGENRQRMVDASRAEYINFLDDDDMVPDDYVSRILPLLDGVDFIGHKIALYSDGVLHPKMATHSIRYDRWFEDENGYYRNLSYMNPIRRELALKVKMHGGYGDDARWAGQMGLLDCVKTEHFIDAAMYLYYHRSQKDDGVLA